jgi:hypothetical protein
MGAASVARKAEHMTDVMRRIVYHGRAKEADAPDQDYAENASREERHNFRGIAN